MKFQFYNDLVMQPDVQEVAQDLLPPIKILENLDDKLKKLPANDLNSAAFAEVSSKVDRLVNKHFPNLVHDYCKLSLEYRNTAIIKRETSKNEVKEYTAKDILLKNLSKLIEEIHVAEHEFNDNYSHKLLVQNRVVNDLGVQKNLLEVQTETVKPVELKNNFDYKNFIKTNKDISIEKPIPVQVKPAIPVNTQKQEDSSSGILTGIMNNIVTIGIIVLSLGGLGGTVYMMYANTQNQVDVYSEARNIMELSSNIKNGYSSLAVMDSDKYKEINYKDISIKKLVEDNIIKDFKVSNGKYANKFDGEYIVKPYTYNTNNDSYSIISTNLDERTCIRLVKQISPAFLTININKIKEDSNVRDEDIIKACSLEENTVEFISR